MLQLHFEKQLRKMSASLIVLIPGTRKQFCVCYTLFWELINSCLISRNRQKNEI